MTRRSIENVPTTSFSTQVTTMVVAEVAVAVSAVGGSARASAVAPLMAIVTATSTGNRASGRSLRVKDIAIIDSLPCDSVQRDPRGSRFTSTVFGLRVLREKLTSGRCGGSIYFPQLHIPSSAAR